jgi:hypothetical protein
MSRASATHESLLKAKSEAAHMEVTKAKTIASEHVASAAACTGTDENKGE